MPVDNNFFVLRGSSLRNSEYIYGMVSYTGHESKIMLNSVRAKAKKSKVEKKMNNYVILIFVSQLTICFITSLINISWFDNHSQDTMSYMEFDKDNYINESSINRLFVKWGTWILIFTNFIPISLLVTCEFVRFI